MNLAEETPPQQKQQQQQHSPTSIKCIRVRLRVCLSYAYVCVWVYVLHHVCTRSLATLLGRMSVLEHLRSHRIIARTHTQAYTYSRIITQYAQYKPALSIHILAYLYIYIYICLPICNVHRIKRNKRKRSNWGGAYDILHNIHEREEWTTTTTKYNKKNIMVLLL